MELSVLSKTEQTKLPSALDRLVATTQSDMNKVNALILERADSHVDMVPELAQYLIEAGGKRLRPMLTIATASMFGNTSGSEVYFAAAVEFMHNATLLHDDVVDESKMRRGQPAARMVWGNQASVLVGDFLLGQAFLMMVETRDLDALTVLSKAATIIAEGEVFQLAKTGDLKTAPEEYDQVIRAKTATLFAAATEVGAMAGGANGNARSAMRTYGLELGRAFQLVDDVLDYGGIAGKLGKNTGDDLREGKMTLPIIQALKSGSSAQRDIIASALGNPDVDENQLKQVVDILEETGALQHTLSQATQCATIAEESLSVLPQSDMRDLLGEIAQFCVSRAH
jgi:octaprenyl-diphosphate synthase